MSAELELARKMQEGIMPMAQQIKNIEDQYGCIIEHHFQMSSELGGDFWGVSQIDESRFRVFTVDLVGHGVSAALNTFRVHAFMAEIPAQNYSPAAYLSALNSKLTNILGDDQFATMFYGIIDISANTLTYAGASTPDPVFGSTQPGIKIEIGTGIGLPLAVLDGASFDDHVVSFGPDNFVFLYSDALIECDRMNAEPIGSDGISEIVLHSLKACSGRPLSALLDRFYGQVKLPLNDDLTAIWISRR
jgi:sigma-B regulation protein RsbU (phosphoserine phosphatase)